MLGSVPPGHVSVYETNEDTSAHFGELSATSLASRGCAGAVLDGGVRDAEYILREDFPVFARYVTPQDCVPRWEVLAHGDVTVVIGGVQVAPGDWIVGDRDGLVVRAGRRRGGGAGRGRAEGRHRERDPGLGRARACCRSRPTSATARSDGARAARAWSTTWPLPPQRGTAGAAPPQSGQAAKRASATSSTAPQPQRATSSGASDELEALEAWPGWTWNGGTPSLTAAYRMPPWPPTCPRTRAPPAGARRSRTCSWWTRTSTSTRSPPSSPSTPRPWDVALREIATVRGALPRPAGHVAPRRVPHPVPRRLEPPPDRDDGRGDARGARRAARRPGGAVPRPPADARDGARPGLRDGARRGLQPLAARALAHEDAR